MRKKKISEEKLSRLAVFTLVIMILFMSIVSIELIAVIYTKKINTEAMSDWTTTKKTTKVYVDDGVAFKKVNVPKEPAYLSNICKKGCKLKTNLIGVEYKYIIKHLDGSYFLDIVKGNEYLVREKNIGKSMENAYFMNYLNYVVLGTVIENQYFEYDFAFVIDNKGLVDEFESLNRDEMMFTVDGVIYYYDECLGNGTKAHKVQARRYPFAKNPVVLDKQEANYSWCK